MEAKSRRFRVLLAWLIAVVLLSIASLDVGIYYGREQSIQANKSVPTDSGKVSEDSGVLVAPATLSQRSTGPVAGDGGATLRDTEFDEKPGRVYAVPNLSAQFAGLELMAKNGDLIAARTLFSRIMTCSDAPRNAAALLRKEEKIKSPDYVYLNSYKNTPGGIETALR